MVEIIFDKNEDWEKRTLCSDESCIGTIGPDGKCKECGRAYDGVARPPGAVSRETKNDIMADLPQSQGLRQDDDCADSISAAEWENRILCRDESCIGVIGPEGKCGECGKPL